MTIEQTKVQWSDVAKDLLGIRYLLPGERVEDLWKRVSLGVEDYERLMSEQLFLPNTPTIVNAGRDNAGTFSACFKFDVPDSMAGIMDVAKKAAMVLKYGGGVGYTLSALRGNGVAIKTTHKVASGPVGFMPIYQAVADSITQGGVRHGAQMAILSCDHPDVEEFIDSKSTEEKAKRFSTFNISVAASDEWMRTAVEDKESKERYLLSKMVQNALGGGSLSFTSWMVGRVELSFTGRTERA